MKENNVISELDFEDREDDGILIPVRDIYIVEKLRKDNLELDQKILEIDQKILEIDQKILKKDQKIQILVEKDQKIQKLVEKDQKILELIRENEELKEKLREKLREKLKENLHKYLKKNQPRQTNCMIDLIENSEGHRSTLKFKNNYIFLSEYKKLEKIPYQFLRFLSEYGFIYSIKIRLEPNITDSEIKKVCETLLQLRKLQSIKLYSKKTLNILAQIGEFKHVSDGLYLKPEFIRTKTYLKKILSQDYYDRCDYAWLPQSTKNKEYRYFFYDPNWCVRGSVALNKSATIFKEFKILFQDSDEFVRGWAAENVCAPNFNEYVMIFSDENIGVLSKAASNPNAPIHKEFDMLLNHPSIYIRNLAVANINTPKKNLKQ